MYCTTSLLQCTVIAEITYTCIYHRDNARRTHRAPTVHLVYGILCMFYDNIRRHRSRVSQVFFCFLPASKFAKTKRASGCYCTRAKQQRDIFTNSRNTVCTRYATKKCPRTIRPRCQNVAFDCYEHKLHPLHGFLGIFMNRVILFHV